MSSHEKSSQGVATTPRAENWNREDHTTEDEIFNSALDDAIDFAQEQPYYSADERC